MTRPPESAPCAINQRSEALEAVLEKGVSASEIRRIRCIVDPRQAELICEPWPQKLAPPNGYAAKWSLPFCLAARALGGPVNVALFEGPLEPQVLAFAQRIDWCAQEDGFPERYPGRLAVTLADGRIVQSYVPDVLGAPGRAFPEEALIRQVQEAAAARPAKSRCRPCWGSADLERAPSLASLAGRACAVRKRAFMRHPAHGAHVSVELIADKGGLDYTRDEHARSAFRLHAADDRIGIRHRRRPERLRQVELPQSRRRLHPASRGSLLLNGAPIRKRGRTRRRIQEHALFPWMTVERNIAYGPRVNGINGAEMNASWPNRSR